MTTLPKFLQQVPGRFWVPAWRSMDGGEPRVYAIDYEASVKARRPLLSDAY